MYVLYLRFASLGNVSITRNGLATLDPVKIEAKGGRILDISLVGRSRDVTAVDLVDKTYSDDEACARIVFEFLDYLDGALIQIVATSRDLVVKLTGTIVGMRDGITHEAEAASRAIDPSERIGPLLRWVGTLLMLLAMIVLAWVLWKLARSAPHRFTVSDYVVQGVALAFYGLGVALSIFRIAVRRWRRSRVVPWYEPPIWYRQRPNEIGVMEKRPEV